MQMQEFITSEITRGISEQSLVIFGILKEGFFEILGECRGAFYIEIMVIVGARTLCFHEILVFGTPGFFREKNPISSERWLADVAFSFYW